MWKIDNFNFHGVLIIWRMAFLCIMGFNCNKTLNTASDGSEACFRQISYMDVSNCLSHGVDWILIVSAVISDSPDNVSNLDVSGIYHSQSLNSAVCIF